MTTSEIPDAEHQSVSRRGFAKAAAAALAVAGFGAAALKGVLARHGDDDPEAERRRGGSGGSGGSGGNDRRRRRRRRNGGSGGSGGSGSGGSGSGGSGNDD
jgi:hypothetical protein